mmetsp:Transcript_89803/g.149314  ORF Transcript_89803/g.149314 Transcript_89803/m.149314 type:complete len:539 (-) Transcript_89803:270-1886(-)
MCRYTSVYANGIWIIYAITLDLGLLVLWVLWVSLRPLKTRAEESKRRIEQSTVTFFTCFLLDLFHVFAEQPLSGVIERGCSFRQRLPVFAGSSQARTHLFGKDLAELDAPLIEAVDAPQTALDGDTVLIESQQLANFKGAELGEEEGIRWPVPGKGLVCHEFLLHTFSPELFSGFAAGQSICLGKVVAHELVVVAHLLSRKVNLLLPGCQADEVTRNQTTLVDQLIEGVLSVSSRLTEYHFAGLIAAFGSCAIDHNSLTVALHADLLNVWCELSQSLAVGQQSVGVETQKSRIPVGQETHENGKILLERGGPEMVVHVSQPCEKLLRYLEAVLQSQGQDTHSTGATEPTTDPVPEAESVGRVNAELFYEFQSGTDGNHVLGNGGLPEGVDNPRPNSSSVQHRLGSRKSLGYDNDQSCLSVETTEGAGSVFRINVGEEVQLAARGGLLRWLVSLKCRMHEQGAQEATSDTHADNIFQRLAGSTNPLTRPDFLGELFDFCENLVHFCHLIHTVNNNFRLRGGTECNVEHRPVLLHVDADA